MAVVVALRYNRAMAKVRGVFERPKDSGIWWVQYFVDGKRHRETAGRKSDAIKLYQKRKADTHAGIKLPTLRGSRGTLLSELVDDALNFAAEHKSIRSYRSRAGIVKNDIGQKAAESITPQEMDAWIRDHSKTPASFNRYRAFFSLCYREGIANKKVKINPARLVRHRKESRGRLRFLSHEEYASLHAIILDKHPQHVAEFVVSVHSGLRLSEQYRATWRDFFKGRRVIELWDTKNTESRVVQLNETALNAVLSVRPDKPDNGAPIFPHPDKTFSNRVWFDPCVRAADIDAYTWHNNRHTFGSWLAMAGASIKEIQEAGGWKSIAMAARYAHLSPAHTRSVVERLVSLNARTF